jgi:hypothetical protein
MSLRAQSGAPKRRGAKREARGAGEAQSAGVGGRGTV